VEAGVTSTEDRFSTMSTTSLLWLLKFFSDILVLILVQLFDEHAILITLMFALERTCRKKIKLVNLPYQNKNKNVTKKTFEKNKIKLMKLVS